MSDDQDGCEWVSVSSGCPGQKPLNGCVCVCLGSPKFFQMCHMTLTTPNWGTVCCMKADTSHGQRFHKVWSFSHYRQQQQQQQPFNGRLSGTTRVGRYQKTHSPAHTHPGQRTSFITFLHLQRSMASSLFSLRA